MKNFYLRIGLWFCTLVFFSCQNINTQTCTNAYWQPNTTDFYLDTIGIVKHQMDCLQISSRIKKYEILSVHFECPNFDEIPYSEQEWKNFSQKNALLIYQKNLEKENLKAIVIEIYKRLEDVNPAIKFDFSINDLITQ